MIPPLSYRLHESLELRRKRLERAYRDGYASQPSAHIELGLHRDNDLLEECFARQAGFMAMLNEDGRFPSWPLDLSTKENQRIMQGYLWDTVRELSEASAELKNRPHRVQEEGFDRAAFLEEMGDAYAFFMEVLILSGLTAMDLAQEYFRKNSVISEALITRER